MEPFDLYKHGAEAAKEVSTHPSGDALREFFSVRTAYWRYPYQHVECGTIGTFDDLKLAPEAAFLLIDTAAEILLAQSDSDLTATAGWLLLQLVQSSKTTQIPQGLQARWDSVATKFSLIEGGRDRASGQLAFQGILEWYRASPRTHAEGT